MERLKESTECQKNFIWNQQHHELIWQLTDFKFKIITQAFGQKIQVTYNIRNNQIGLGLDRSDIQFQKMEKQHIFIPEGRIWNPGQAGLSSWRQQIGCSVNSVRQSLFPQNKKLNAWFVSFLKRIWNGLQS